jgi:hypothetical protein
MIMGRFTRLCHGTQDKVANILKVIITLYIQQMHTLYYVKHFIGLPTCFDPEGSSSGHLIHWTSLCCYIYYTYKVLYSMWLSYKCIVCIEYMFL